MGEIHNDTFIRIDYLNDIFSLSVHTVPIPIQVIGTLGKNFPIEESR